LIEKFKILTRCFRKITTDYRYLYVQHNYIFYRISNNDILIIDIFNEREDFMWKLFGIKQVVDPSEDE